MDKTSSLPQYTVKEKQSTNQSHCTAKSLLVTVAVLLLGLAAIAGACLVAVALCPKGSSRDEHSTIDLDTKERLQSMVSHFHKVSSIDIVPVANNLAVLYKNSSIAEL